MEDEVESFEVTDYDLENEFNFKRGKKMTKNERIYGIWAENESSGDEGGSSRRPAFRGGKKVKNYTAPIGFVAGGIQQSGKKTEAEKKKGESDESDDDDAKDGLRGKSSRHIKNSSSEESEEENVRSFRQNYDNPVIHGECFLFCNITHSFSIFPCIRETPYFLILFLSLLFLIYSYFQMKLLE